MNITPEMITEDEKRWHTRDVITELGYCGNYMRDRKDMTNLDIRFYAYIMRKACDMLKAQMPRVMTLEEVTHSEDWLWREYTSGYCEWCRQIDVCKLDNSIVWNDGYIETLDDYAQRWRCWTSRPSPEQIANTPWEGDAE